MPERNPALSVVLPCRNQAEHIGAVLESYFAPLDGTGLAWELVVVPNACTDETPAIVSRLAEREGRIVVVESARGGWGLSVRIGLEASRGEILCYTNSARTDPAQLPPLLHLYLDHRPCLAKARREQRSAPLRELGSWFFNLEGRLLFGVPGWDVNGTPKVFSRDIYARVALESAGDLLDLELVAKTIRLGLPVVERTVLGFRRHGGRSSTTLWSAAKLYAGALKLRGTL